MPGFSARTGDVPRSHVVNSGGPWAREGNGRGGRERSPEHQVLPAERSPPLSPWGCPIPAQMDTELISSEGRRGLGFVCISGLTTPTPSLLPPHRGPERDRTP